MVMVCVFLLLPSAHVWSAVSGDCSNCHTMHHSQTPWPWDMNWGGQSSPPEENLLVADCVGCHTNYTDGNTIIELGSGSGTSDVPIVHNVSLPATPLAGGNFYWVAQGDDTKGHNVAGIVNEDGNLNEAPGKSGGCANSCHKSLASAGRGCQGCHLNPRHHADDSATIVGASGGWFRFLSGHQGGEGSGVEGIEDTDWQATKGSDDHNEYLCFDGPKTGSGTFSSLGNTMTGFCTGCHGTFHQQDDTPTGVSPWLRHPSDFALPNRGEYADAFGAGGTGTGTYDPDVPVGRPSLTAVSNVVTIGTDMVMCLSCHRAHGSPYFKILRWDYRGNEWTGCATCHTWKQ